MSTRLISMVNKRAGEPMTNDPAAEARRGLRRKSTATLVVTLMLAVYWTALFYGTHARLPPGALPGNSDKMIHFGAFLGLGTLLMTLRATRGAYSWTDVFIRWCVLVGYGAFDETTQTLVGRDAELFDWLADSAGAAAGILLVTFVCRRFPGSLARFNPARSADLPVTGNSPPVVGKEF